MITVYANVSVKDLWEMDEFMEPYHNATETDTELLGEERITPQKVQLQLQIDSIEYEDISMQIAALLKFIKSASERIDGMSLERRI